MRSIFAVLLLSVFIHITHGLSITNKVRVGTNDTADSSRLPALFANDGMTILQNTHIKTSAAMMEYIATTLYVLIGCGSTMGIAKVPGSAWVFRVSLTFGFIIAVLTSTMSRYKVGQMNCAVTFAMVLAEHLTVAQGVLNVIAQILGSLTGAIILAIIYPRSKDLTGWFAANTISEGFGHLNALMGETMMTALLVFVVLEFETNPKSTTVHTSAPIAIGFVVFLAHSVLIPVDGCSINPARSCGPAIVAQFVIGNSRKALDQMWIFCLGPLLGAAVGAAMSSTLFACRMGESWPRI